MDITKEQVRVLSEMRGLSLPEEDLQAVANRMSLWMAAFDQIEAELGAEMDRTDPVPPVLPHAELP